MKPQTTDNEVARLRKYIDKLEIYSPENEWSLPEWRKLIGSKEEQEDPETLFKLYQFRLEPGIRGETNEVARLRELLNRAIKIQEEKCTSCRCYHCDALEMELEIIKRETNQLTK